MKYNVLKKKWHDIKGSLRKANGLAPEESSLWYSLLGQVLSDTNANLEEAVYFDLTNTSYVQENYCDEIAGGDCNIFDEEEEDTDKETNTPMPNKIGCESVPRKKTCGETSSEKKSCMFSNPDPVLTCKQLQSHAIRHKGQMNFDNKRDKAFLEF